MGVKKIIIVSFRLKGFFLEYDLYYLTLFFRLQGETISLNFINIFLCFFLIIPSAPTVTGMAFVFIFHMLVISISRSLSLLSFANTLAELLLSDGTLISINWNVLFCLCLITISGLLACSISSNGKIPEDGYLWGIHNR